MDRVIYRVAPLVLAGLSLLVLLVSTVAVVVSKVQAGAAYTRYQTADYDEAGYDGLLQSYYEAVDVVNAWGSFVLLGFLGVLLTLVVYSLRQPRETATTSV